MLISRNAVGPVAQSALRLPVQAWEGGAFPGTDESEGSGRVALRHCLEIGRHSTEPLSAFCDNSIRALVTPPKAETTTTVLPRTDASLTRRSTPRLRSGEPTEVPPNFMTLMAWKPGAEPAGTGTFTGSATFGGLSPPLVEQGERGSIGI